MITPESNAYFLSTIKNQLNSMRIITLFTFPWLLEKSIISMAKWPCHLVAVLILLKGLTIDYDSVLANILTSGYQTFANK